jgi:hypothetical protein
MDVEKMKAIDRASLYFLLAYFPYFEKSDPEVPGSIPGASTFSESQRVCNGVHSAS